MGFTDLPTAVADLKYNSIKILFSIYLYLYKY